MSENIPTRADALALLKEYNDNQNLVKHGLAVEATMRHFAKKYGEDEEKWGIIGLAHDLDYGKYPEEHCKKTPEILQEAGWPEDWINSILSHGWKLCTDVKPEQKMEKILYTIDELTGLVIAVALVRPSKSLHEVDLAAVNKKWKEKSFAAGASREVIQDGIDLLEADRDEIVSETIVALQGIADELGLAGK